MQRQQAREAVGEQQPPKAPLRVNLTDPHSRLMPTRKGWVQGYNVQVGVTADQLIVATRVSQHTNDSEEFIAMMAAVQQAAELFQAAGRDEARGSVARRRWLWHRHESDSGGPGSADRLSQQTSSASRRGL